jgi:hypothetical protein
LVAAERDRPAISEWFQAAGHSEELVEHVALPDYVSFTDWAEDAYVAINDGDESEVYLMEPWEFPRVGDALIADAVEEYTNLRATQAPLVFQGGNCLIGDDFWLLGTDYFTDTMNLLMRGRPPVEVPREGDLAGFTAALFSQYVDQSRRMLLIGAGRPIALREFYGTCSSGQYFLDIPRGGVGHRQPIFHIDMFITLIGRGQGGQFELLVGSPRLADEVLGTVSPYALNDVYDAIAKRLEDEGFKVHRNPLAHVPSLGETIPFARLREISVSSPDGASMSQAVRELQVAGATDETGVTVREWWHLTWNNCLVENSERVGRNVYLPTFGWEQNSDIAQLDNRMAELWDDLGFNVFTLGDFREFARRQGVVHCIKKYIQRGS